MRKLRLQMQMSVDGFVAGPNGELDWMTWNMDELSYIMVVKSELFKWKKMFNIFYITGNEIIHCHHIKPFLDKTVAKMGA